MNQPSLNPLGKKLQSYLQAARHHLDTQAKANEHAEKVHVAGAGVVTAAYEQLRIAAENAEEHLLLQRAIRRFYRRLFLTRDNRQIANSGEELAIELTQAGYLLNDTLQEETLKKIDALAREYYAAYEELLKGKTHSKRAEAWTLEVLAVRVEWLLNDPSLSSAYIQFVYDYYSADATLRSLFDAVPADFDTALYVATQRALLKADLASIRAGLLSRYQQTPDRLEHYSELNKQIDELITSSTVEILFRYVDRHGAPLRVLKHLIEDDEDIAARLSRTDEFLNSYESQVDAEYKSITKRINRGIIKSVIFLIITKFIIGLAIEIPYDYLVIGSIAVLPLVINLFFPPIYMLLLRGTLILPGKANTQHLSRQMEQILFGEQKKELRSKRVVSFGAGYNVVYALAFVLVFGGLGYLLHAAFEFELLHLFIFFLFLSGASFLGFRLSRLIREVEAIDSDQNAITTVRDFLYMPFVVVGRYMSEKYTQLNIVALTLDMLIELPLKTILRLIRQWTAFIGSKKDQL